MKGKPRSRSGEWSGVGVRGRERTAGARGAGGFAGCGFGGGGWHVGENEVVGVGELPGIVGGGADEVAPDADSVLLGVEIDDGEPELAVCGARVGAAGRGDVGV